jgi:predicted CxxxxCH...CXXCH cytochrome family protein
MGTRGETLTNQPAVGAHQRHLVGGSLRGPLACADCHTVPTDFAHASQPLDLTWGSLARTGGAVPTWNGTSFTCANYCHGSNMTGGTLTAPAWNKVDGTQAACGTCHGLPPAAPHPRVSGGVAACAGCHSSTVNADGTINLAGGLHIDGRVQLSGGSGSCTGCHGDATRSPASIAAAPPSDTSGNVATTAPGVGAHQKHLVGGSIRAALECTECHTVPSDLAHASQPLDLTWGTLAKANGAAPSWNATALTCANFCHGSTMPGGTLTAPVWNKVDGSQAACGTCHGLPPPSPHPAVASITGCVGCHASTVSADGTIDVAGGMHVNGVVNFGGSGGSLACDACHGFPPATGAHLTHMGWTAGAGSGAYGDTRILEDFVPLGAPPASFYAFGCGNCHPLDASRHMDGTLEVELSGAGAPVASLKARNPSSATYTSGTATCSNVYCHSSGQQDDVGLGTPVFVSTPSWRSGQKLTCAGCHGNPPAYRSGSAGSPVANSHVDLVSDVAVMGHFGGLPGPYLSWKHGRSAQGQDAAPITCQTCHFATVDPANVGPSGFYYLDTTGSYSVAGVTYSRTCVECHSPGSPDAPVGTGRVLPLRHVNGRRDVVFDPRDSMPSGLRWPFAAASWPTRPYWSWPGNPGTPVPGSGMDGQTFSLTLAGATYDPATKTCSSVGCHLQQTSVVWGTTYVVNGACRACHGY